MMIGGKDLQKLLTGVAMCCALALPGARSLAQEASASAEEPIEEASEAAIVERKIDEAFGNAWLGASDPDVVLVVFADYACPACREAQPVIDALLAADPRVKVVYRILINEDEGRQAALTSLAVAQTPADWARFHRAMDLAGEPTAKSIAAVLKTQKIAPASLPPLDELGTANEAIFEEVSHNDRLIVEREGTAVPAWVIGQGKATNGFTLEQLQAAVAKARSRRNK